MIPTVDYGANFYGVLAYNGIKLDNEQGKLL